MQEQGNVLLIDDDMELCTMLESYLSRHGWKVHAVHTGRDGLRCALADSPDLIILDGMLPDYDGFDVLRRIRSEGSTPVLLLTARGEEIDRIVGLEIGADDYLGKPFNPRELIARMRAIYRRSGVREPKPQDAPEARFTVDERKREVAFRKEPVPLTDIEYRLLTTLLRRVPQIADREELTVQAFERASRPFDRSLDMHVSRLRKKLESLEGFSGTVKSIRNTGYLLVLDSNGPGEGNA
jgi:two-component system response regulator CpxR